MAFFSRLLRGRAISAQPNFLRDENAIRDILTNLSVEGGTIVRNGRNWRIVLNDGGGSDGRGTSYLLPRLNYNTEKISGNFSAAIVGARYDADSNSLIFQVGNVAGSGSPSTAVERDVVTDVRWDAAIGAISVTKETMKVLEASGTEKTSTIQFFLYDY